MQVQLAQKIIWAIDVLAHEETVLEKLALELNAWTAKIQANIEPVFVMSAWQMHCPDRFFEVHRQEFAAKMLGDMRQTLARLPIKRLAEPKIVIAREHGLRGVSSALLDYARKENASMLAIASHTHGLKRLAIGSFCEAMMLLSEIPILAVRPQMRVSAKISTILLPVDLNQSSSEDFDRALAIAKQQQAKLLILHVAEYLDHLTAATFGPAAEYYAAVEDEKKHRQRQLDALVKASQTQGVDAEWILSENIGGPDAAIIETAQKINGGVIVMMSCRERGDFPSLSSVARKVLHDSDIPVCVWHQRPQDTVTGFSGGQRSPVLAKPAEIETFP